jgi:norsolorinic acid ketoreductase
VIPSLPGWTRANSDCVYLDAGWLQTDMGNRAAEAAHLSEAPQKLEHGIEAMIELLDKANREEHGGKFLAYEVPGGALPW